MSADDHGARLVCQDADRRAGVEEGRSLWVDVEPVLGKLRLRSSRGSGKTYTT